MTAAYDVALDDIYSVLNVAWLGGAAAVVGYVPEIRWPGVEDSTKPDGSKFWARISTQTVTEEQTGFGVCPTETNAMRTTAFGLVFVQLFCPKNVDTSFEFGKLLAKLVRSAYRGRKTVNGVWFRNVRINELSAEDLWHRFNVIAEYEYDEVA